MHDSQSQPDMKPGQPPARCGLLSCRHPVLTMHDSVAASIINYKSTAILTKRLISPKFNYISAFLTTFDYKRLQTRKFNYSGMSRFIRHSLTINGHSPLRRIPVGIQQPLMH